jgi:hypothetical protein
MVLTPLNSGFRVVMELEFIDVIFKPYSLLPWQVQNQSLYRMRLAMHWGFEYSPTRFSRSNVTRIKVLLDFILWIQPIILLHLYMSSVVTFVHVLE